MRAIDAYNYFTENNLHGNFWTDLVRARTRSFERSRRNRQCPVYSNRSNRQCHWQRCISKNAMQCNNPSAAGIRFVRKFAGVGIE